MLNMRSSKTHSEATDLDRLLGLLSVFPSKQRLPSLESDFNGNVKRSHSGAHSQSTEARALEDFSKKYEDERNFQSNSQRELIEQIFSALVKNRLCNEEWSVKAPPENRLPAMTVMRILMRDSVFQRKFVELNGLKTLCIELELTTKKYREDLCSYKLVHILIEMTNIIQKLARIDEYKDVIILNGAHKSLFLLLWARDVTLLHCTLYALCDLSQREIPRQQLAELNVTEQLVNMLEENYDLDSKRHAAKLLKGLCADKQIREMVKVYDGIPVLLKLLNDNDLKLLRYAIWCINQLAEDSDTSDELRRAGVIPLLLSHLHNKKYSDSEEVTAPASANLGGRSYAATMTMDESSQSNEQLIEQVCLMKSACCAALTELIRNDHNSQQIVSHNGVYSLGMLILPDQVRSKATENLQKSALRTLRFLFSLEGNRRRFKRIFQNSQSVFTAFIDVGHYVLNIDKYQSITDLINNLPESDLDDLREAIENSNQQREVTQYVDEYAILEQLGSGAFGSVSKVRKRSSGQTFYALKEVNLATIGKTAKERDKSIGEIVNEINIVRDQMKHPNIVKYYKTFTIESRLYILMELIDGAPLMEHFNSLKEKNESFTEARVWNIFVQIVLALRYLHKEKHIVHRDLSPNNIMLSDNDHVTITDFGLAKHKKVEGYLKSRVGTLLYHCPELVQDHPYGEKADIWAIGCILYQMCTLTPPFYTTNMLALASKIVSGDYEPLPDGKFSSKVSETIARCLTVDQGQRPDVTGLAGFIAEELMCHMEKDRHDKRSLERKLEKEKKRTVKHYNKVTNYMKSYEKLFIASQEKLDKLTNSQSSLNLTHLDANNNTTEGGVSGDDEEEPSSSESNNSAESLSRAFNRPPKPPVISTRRKLEFSNNLEVLIPPVVTRNGCRDSGISSAGEPSPNDTLKPSASTFHRSFSSPVSQDKKLLKSDLKKRPNSSSRGTTTLTISPRKVRQINDPIQQMLHVLHKIIYITQLPPAMTHNPRRTIVEKFKRALFSSSTTSANLKAELKKLANGSPELVDINLGNIELRAANASAHSKPNTIAYENGLETDLANGVSYEQMLTLIEAVLKESDYYKIPKDISKAQK